jgi:hypothetical protein
MWTHAFQNLLEDTSWGLAGLEERQDRLMDKGPRRDVEGLRIKLHIIPGHARLLEIQGPAEVGEDTVPSIKKEPVATEGNIITVDQNGTAPPLSTIVDPESIGNSPQRSVDQTKHWERKLVAHHLPPVDLMGLPRPHRDPLQILRVKGPQNAPPLLLREVGGLCDHLRHLEGDLGMDIVSRRGEITTDVILAIRQIL